MSSRAFGQQLLLANTEANGEDRYTPLAPPEVFQPPGQHVQFMEFAM